MKVEIVPALGHFGRTLVAFSPTGRHAISTTSAVTLWEVATGRLVRTIHDPAGTISAAFSPNGALLATGGWDGTLTIWNIGTGERLRTFSNEFGSESALLTDAYTVPIAAIAFAPDGKRLLAARHGMLNLRDIASGALLFEQCEANEFTRVAFCRDGTRFLAGGRESLELRDAATGALLRSLTRSQSREPRAPDFEIVAFSPDDKHALTARGQTLTIWNLARGKVRRSIQYPGGGTIGAIAVSPDGRFALSGIRSRGTGDPRPQTLWDFVRHQLGWRAVDPGALTLWKMPSGRQRGTLEGRLGAVASVALSPDGRHALAGNPGGIAFGFRARRIRHAAMDGTPELFDLARRQSLRTFSAHIAPVTAVAFSRDGTRFAASSYECCGRSHLHVWDARTGARLAVVEEGSHVTSIALSCDGRRLLTGGGLTGVSKSLKLWDMDSGRPRAFAEPSRLGGSNWIYGVALAPDDSKVLSGGSDDGQARLWDAASGRLLRTFDAFSGSVAFAPDGARILTGAWDTPDHALRLWEAASGRLLHAFAYDGPSGTNAIAFSPEGARVLMGAQNRATLWDAAGGAQLMTLEGDADEIYAVAFSPDGRHILTGGADSTIKIWDVTDGRRVRTLVGHTAEINAVACSPDGRRVISGGNDSTVRMWDGATGELLATFLATAADWLALTPAGFFRASPEGVRFLNAVRGFEVAPARPLHAVLQRPDLVEDRLTGGPAGLYAQAVDGLDLADFLGPSMAGLRDPEIPRTEIQRDR